MSYYSDPEDEAISYAERIDELEAAIRKHRDEHGDDRCWQDDCELYNILPEGYDPPKMDEPVMLENCKRYIERRQCPITKYVPNLVEQEILDRVVSKGLDVKLTSEFDLDQIANMYGIVVHAAIKSGFTVRQIEDRELQLLKERFPNGQEESK
jgi:hypothetical protein